MLKFFIYLFIIICFGSCINKEPSIASVAAPPKPSSIIVINRTSNKNLLFKYFDYYNNSQLTPFAKNDTLVIKTNYPIVTYDTEGRTFNDLTYFTLYPNDTIRLETKGNKVVFTAQNVQLRKKMALMSKLYFNVGSMNYSTKGSFASGIKAIDAFYSNKMRIIDSNKNNLDNASIKEVINIVDYDKIASMILIYNQFNKNYGGVLSDLKMADSSAWGYLTFRNIIANYNVYINKFYRVTDAPSHVKFLRAKLSKNIQDYAVFYYLTNYRPDNSNKLDTLNQLVTEFSKQSSSQNLSDNLRVEIKKYNSNFQAKDSKEIALLSAANDKPKSLSMVIKENKGKLIYIDFWATWCVPCLGEMPSSSALVNRYKALKAPVTFIYLSQDENMYTWQNKSKDLKLSPTESFIILKNKSFDQFLSRYNLRTIPRYMLIGKKGEMLETDAPHPSDPKLKLLIDKML